MVSAGRAVAAVAKQGKEQTAAKRRREAQRELAVPENKQPEIAVVTSSEIQPVNLERNIPELNPAAILDHVDDVFRYYTRWQDPHERRVFALWTASTWFVDPTGALRTNGHPRAFFIGEKGSGKTQSMKVSSEMVRQSSGIVKRVTEYGLRDAMEAHDTLLLDEIDREIVTGRANMGIQSLISAYEGGTVTLNGKEGGNNKTKAFSPVAMTAKPRIRHTTGGWIDDLFERSFIFDPGNYENPRDQIPELDEDFFDVTYAVARVLDIWSSRLWDDLKMQAVDRAIAKYDLDMTTDYGRMMAARAVKNARYAPIHPVPDELTGRMRQIASPLLAVADRAVDPKVMRANAKAGKGYKDTRWAEQAREDIMNVLLGHGDDAAEIVASLDEKFKKMGL